MSEFVEGKSRDYESLMKKLSPKELVALAMYQPDPEQIITEITKDKDGKYLFIGHAKYSPVDWNGLWCPDEFAKIVDNIVHKPTKTDWEQEFTDAVFEIFYKYMDDCDAFANWDNYYRFVVSISEDFFGRD